MPEPIWKDESQAYSCKSRDRKCVPAKDGCAPLGMGSGRCDAATTTGLVLRFLKPSYVLRMVFAAVGTRQVRAKVQEWAGGATFYRNARGRVVLPHLFRLLFVQQTTAPVLRKPEAERGKQRSPQKR